MDVWQYRVITINTEYETAADSVLRYAHALSQGETQKSSADGDEIIQSHLEIMGREGWELVSLIPAQPTAQNWKGISTANPWLYHAVFKRPQRDK